MLKPSSDFYGSFLLISFAFVFSVPCRLVITCWAYLLPLSCVMFPCVFVTFPHDVSGKVWYMIASISDLCLFLDFYGAHIIIIVPRR